MENIRNLFNEHGYSLLVHPEDDKSFYCCLHSIIQEDKHPVNAQNAYQMQKDIFEYEKKNSLYFHLFKPQCFDCNGNHSAADCLKCDFGRMSAEKRPPSPRECYAAADFLRRRICVVRYDPTVKGDLKSLRGYIFAPIDKSGIMEPVCILMFEKQPGSLQFANIFCSDNLTTDLDLNMLPAIIKNKEHIHCFGLRFANEFTLLFDNSVPNCRKTDVKDLYRFLSLKLYGKEEYHERIINTICNFELEDDNLELFVKFADRGINEKKSLSHKRKILCSHVEKIRNRLEEVPGDGEFYALSSVYNVDIIVDKTGRGQWQKFMAVVCTYASSFDSLIILQNQGQKGKVCYGPYDTQPDSCFCCQNIPEIQGHIAKIENNIHMPVCKYHL